MIRIDLLEASESEFKEERADTVKAPNILRDTHCEV